MTKLDGTAKGGCVVAVKQRLGLPVRFIGVGEGTAPFSVPSRLSRATAPLIPMQSSVR